MPEAPKPAKLVHHALGVTWFEDEGMGRAAHAIRTGENTWLIDPFDDPAALSAISELGLPSGVIQLLDRHNRDCAELAKRLAVPLHKVPEALPESPFEVISVVDRRWWHEVALWLPAASALIVAEAVGTAPLFALGRAAGVHPMLRMVPPRAALGGLRPEHLLVGHGPPIESGAADALAQALSTSRADFPRLLTKLPAVIRSS